MPFEIIIYPPVETDYNTVAGLIKLINDKYCTVFRNYGQLADGSTRQRQLAGV